jgi:hypothetical protein
VIVKRKEYKLRKTINKRKGKEGNKCSENEWRRKKANRYYRRRMPCSGM